MKISQSLLVSVASSTLLGLFPSSSSTAYAFSVPSAANVSTAQTTTQLASTGTAFKSYEVDVEESFASSTFPIKPDDLITRAKEVLSEKINVGINDGGECLSEEFTFRAQFVEINKEGYINALAGFKLTDSFDINPNYFGFSVDPMQTNRVWFFSRSIATQIAPFAGQDVSDDAGEIVLPPQTFHLDFDEKGLVTEIGFYTVDRAQGTTGGLGGAFAYFWAVGKPLPFPEAKPYKPSLKYRLIQKIGNLAQKFSKKKKDA
jgi:hypothetical protein